MLLDLPDGRRSGARVIVAGLILGAGLMKVAACAVIQRPDAPTKPIHIKWQSPTYKGVTLGRSKRVDVETLFGKPVWSGPPEEKLIDQDREAEVLLEYEDIGGVPGQTTVVLGARTDVVKAIDVYPREPFRLNDALEEFGKDYIERESALGPCPTPSDVRKFKPPPEREYPVFLVYPSRGMYLAVDADGTVPHIGYLASCS